jgi:hypothetical protein
VGIERPRIETANSGVQTEMKAFLGCAALALVTMTTTVPADAKGCIKGAVVGGIAGHAAHHAFLGAVTGCVVGHHLAKKHENEAPAAGQDSAPSSAPAPAAGKQQ